MGHHNLIRNYSLKIKSSDKNAFVDVYDHHFILIFRFSFVELLRLFADPVDRSGVDLIV